MTKNGDLKFNHRSLASAGDQDPKAGNKYETRPHLASRPSPILSHLFSRLPELSEGTSSSELCPSCHKLCKDTLLISLSKEQEMAPVQSLQYRVISDK